MILSVKEYLTFNPTDNVSSDVLEAKLRGIESAIRAYTNNNFQKRNIRFICPVVGNKLSLNTNLLKAGDTVQISASKYNDGVYDIISINDGLITLNENPEDEDRVTVTKVVYPPDIKIGVVNLMKWDAESRDKIGIASETLSRHSVTYSDMTGANSILTFPAALTGFLEPYRKARF